MRYFLGSVLFLAALCLFTESEAVAGSQPFGGFAPNSPTGDLPYVIITTKKLAGSFQQLASWKTKTGLPAQVVTVESIQADPTVAGNDLPEKIRSFLRFAHENWNTRWILLGGHVTEVPSRGTFVKHGKYHSAGNLSDLYFADVLPEKADGTDVDIYNWNGDGDNRFGENRDGMDLVPEMYVARLPFQTSGQADTYLRKYFTYVHGRDGEHFGRALLVGAEEFRRAEESLAVMIEGLTSKSEYRIDKLIEVPVSEIVKGMSCGYGIMDIYGHGCPHHLWLGEKRSHFGVPQIETLSNENRCGIVYSHGCSSNDYRNWESMGIAFLLHPKGGAVAYTGYTAASFGSPVYRTFYQLVFTGRVPQLARAFAEGKKKLTRDIWMNEYLNILGEPEMWVWTAKPKNLKVEGTPQAGRPARLRVVDPDGKGVSGARVCLWARGQYLVGTGDAGGWIDLSAIETAGTTRITVIAQNHRPFEGTIKVGRAEGPVLKAPRFLVDDDAEGGSRGNGNGDLSPDETVEIRLEWPTPPETGTLRLELDDPFVEVLQGEVAAGDPEAVFRLKIPGGVRPGHNVWLTLRLTVPGVEGSWRWRRGLPVRGPSLRCIRARLDDRKGNKDGRVGWEDAGGSIGMFLTVYNGGNQTAKECALTLTSDDAAVKMTGGSVRLGPLKPRDSAESRTPFTFELDPAFDGHPLAFTLEMRDRDGGRWKASIRIAVPPAPPILLTHQATTTAVLLAWRPGGSPGVAGYYVYRGKRSGGPYKRLTEKPIRGMTGYRDAGVKCNGDFYYVVTAVTAEGLESVYSLERRARPLTPLWGKRR